MQHPVLVGDVFRIEDAVTVLEGVAVGKVVADKGGVDGAVDHRMGHMNAFRPQLPGQALGQGPQRELGAGEGAETGAAAQGSGGPGENQRPLCRGTITRAASRPVRKPAKAAISQTLR